MVVGAPAVAVAGRRIPPGGGPGTNIHFTNPLGSGLPIARGMKPAPCPLEFLRGAREYVGAEPALSSSPQRPPFRAPPKTRGGGCSQAIEFLDEPPPFYTCTAPFTAASESFSSSQHSLASPSIVLANSPLTSSARPLGVVPGPPSISYDSSLVARTGCPVGRLCDCSNAVAFSCTLQETSSACTDERRRHMPPRETREIRESGLDAERVRCMPVGRIDPAAIGEECASPCGGAHPYPRELGVQVTGVCPRATREIHGNGTDAERVGHDSVLVGPRGSSVRTPTAKARDLRTLIDLKLGLPCHPRGDRMN